MNRRLIITATILAIFGVTSVGAFAAWTKSGAGNGAGKAPSVTKGATPSASASGSTVTVTFNQATLTPTTSVLVTNYTVKRDGTTITCGSQSITAGVVSCQETGVANGTGYKYTVVPNYQGWKGTESDQSAGVNVNVVTSQLKITDVTSSSTSGKFTVSGTTTNKAVGERSVTWRTCVGLNAASSCTTANSGTANVNGTTGAWSTGSINVANGTTNYTIFVSQVTNSAGTLTDKQSWTQGQTLSF